MHSEGWTPYQLSYHLVCSLLLRLPHPSLGNWIASVGALNEPLVWVSVNCHIHVVIKQPLRQMYTYANITWQTLTHCGVVGDGSTENNLSEDGFWTVIGILCRKGPVVRRNSNCWWESQMLGIPRLSRAVSIRHHRRLINAFDERWSLLSRHSHRARNEDNGPFSPSFAFYLSLSFFNGLFGVGSMAIRASVLQLRLRLDA